MRHDIVLIPGDGIGPEVASAVQKILEAAGCDINWIERHAGLAALEQGADVVLPQDTIDAIAEHKIALKSPATTPVGGGFSSVNVALRKNLNLYGAVRPVRSFQGVPTRFENVDLVVIRENTEGLYAGIENTITEGVVTSLKVATDKACRRIADFAFNYARTHGRKKVTVLHKANIMKLSDGLFLRCAREQHAEKWSDIELDDLIIDAGCMRIVQEPTNFDMLLCENLYGDVISDLCAGLIGGLGVSGGANFGEDDAAIFEAVHGSAPDIAGRNLANPLALLLSALMMLRHLAATRGDADSATAADRIETAFNACLNHGEKTGDLGGSLGTTQFADAVIARLNG
jgi:isocitrate dehydrogenase (NAD+)